MQERSRANASYSKSALAHYHVRNHKLETGASDHMNSPSRSSDAAEKTKVIHINHLSRGNVKNRSGDLSTHNSNGLLSERLKMADGKSQGSRPFLATD